MIKIITESNDRPVYVKWFDANDTDMYTEFYDSENEALYNISGEIYDAERNGELAIYDAESNECLDIYKIDDEGRAVDDDGFILQRNII